jgi:hypothetical protein
VSKTTASALYACGEIGTIDYFFLST